MSLLHFFHFFYYQFYLDSCQKVCPTVVTSFLSSRPIFVNIINLNQHHPLVFSLVFFPLLVWLLFSNRFHSASNPNFPLIFLSFFVIDYLVSTIISILSTLSFRLWTDIIVGACLLRSPNCTFFEERSCIMWPRCHDLCGEGRDGRRGGQLLGWPCYLWL